LEIAALSKAAGGSSDNESRDEQGTEDQRAVG
jgi:hypothetical protein